jgi:C1A family cysteine protease
VKQPVSVMVASSSLHFQLYKKGIFNGNCGEIPNHSMLLVGYGDVGEGKYWKLKNSWGLSWGQQGYMFLSR